MAKRPEDRKYSKRTVAQVDQELEKLSDYRLESMASDPIRKVIGGWDGLDDDEQNSQRASEQLARRRRMKQLEKAKAEKEAAEKQQREKAFNQALEQHMSEMRAAFGGTDQQWQQVKGQLEQEWLLEQAKSGTTLEQHREQLIKSGIYNRLV